MRCVLLILTLLAILPLVNAKNYDDVAIGIDETEAEVSAVTCDTTKGRIRMVVNNRWAPTGAAWFLAMVKAGFFDGQSVHRHVPNVLVQFGISGEPEEQRKWEKLTNLSPDPNLRLLYRPGMISFLCDAKNNTARSTKIWVTTSTNDGQNQHFGQAKCETPLGVITEGMFEFKQMSQGIGEVKEYSNDKKGLSIKQLRTVGTKALKRFDKFDKIDFIEKCQIVDTTQQDIAEVRLKDWPLRDKSEEEVKEEEDAYVPPDPIKVRLVNNYARPLDLFSLLDDTWSPASVMHVGVVPANHWFEDGTYIGHKYVWKEVEGGTEVNSHVIEEFDGADIGEEKEVEEDEHMVFSDSGYRVYFAAIPQPHELKPHKLVEKKKKTDDKTQTTVETKKKQSAQLHNEL